MHKEENDTEKQANDKGDIKERPSLYNLEGRKTDGDIHKHNKQIGDDSVYHQLFPIRFGRIPKVAEDKGMFFPRIIAGNIGQTSQKGGQ